MSNLKKFQNACQDQEESVSSQAKNQVAEVSQSTEAANLTTSEASFDKSKDVQSSSALHQNHTLPQSPSASAVITTTTNQIIGNSKFVETSLQSFEGQIQQQNQEIQAYQAIPLQIGKTSSDIKIFFEQKIEQKLGVLDLLMKYCPNPVTEKDEQGNIVESEFNKYCKEINEFKDALVHFRSWPTQLDRLQVNTKRKVNEFKRIQSEIVTRAKQHLQITYRVTKEDLLDSYKENQQFITNCKEFKDQLDEEINKLTLKKADKIANQLKLSLNQIYGFDEDFEKSTLNNLQIELSTIETQRGKDILDVAKNFEISTKSLYEKKVNLEFINKQIQDEKSYQSYEDQAKKEAQEQLQKYKQSNKAEKQDQINHLSKQIQELTKKEQDLLTLEQDEKDQEYSKKMASLARLHSTLGTSSANRTPKTCFHYIYLIDESGSFTGSPHDSGIKGIIESIQRLNQNDFVSIIKFDSSSQVKFEKTQKGSINMTQLRSSIQKCNGGGTSFTSAFQLLQQYIKKSVGQDEYLIVIFITDGQDSCNITPISQTIRSQCGDFTFYSIGYGSINEEQLRTITNVMNDTLGCTKNINSKSVQLFYKNANPQQLLTDLAQIADQSSKISIQDIQQTQKSIESLSNSMNDNISSYYSSKRSAIINQIKSLSDQKSALEMSDTKAYESKTNDVIQKIQKDIDDRHARICELEKRSSALQTEISDVTNKFKQLYPYTKQSNDLESIRDMQQDIINKEAQKKIAVIEDKMIEEEKQRIDSHKKQLQSVQKYGFQTVEKFLKLFKIISEFQEIQESFTRIVDSLQDMVNSLIEVSKLLDKNILISANNLKALKNHNSMERLIEYFSNYDDSISPSQGQQEAKLKILLITDNSAYLLAAKHELTQFYEGAVLQFDMTTVLTNYEADDKELKKIRNQIQRQLVPKTSKIINLENKMKKYQGKKEEHEQKIEALKKKLDNETNERQQEKLEAQIEDLDSKIEGIDKEISGLEEQLSTLESEFDEQNEVKIKIVHMIFNTMIQAVKNSVLRYQFKASIMPFMDLVAIQSASQKALKEY